ncbi:MAG: Pleiotropic regulatory protein [Candidatus Gottesmanbacteria bacterium GW2011_GWA2_42_18]|uniref:Pleiotropic regulatory protein n=1 Tax=Candidatus Gottesmanbacteria bacterium GW2011_GWA2_42_18 TaxID=1618442 RepID=A0A0G0ZA23_9BACT|nr:MAG: Pleiotropic regulatory protein [Candidatus Gottesmanbacteria bacterium GW2011_GWA2_42_18]
MKLFDRPLTISLSPNLEKDDILLALSVLLNLRHWQHGNHIKQAENWFKEYFKTKEVFSFNSGRSALYFILKAFGIEKDDEVIIQAFTCVAVPEPLIWLGAKPIYADIDQSLNIDPGLLEKLITPKTRVIIVQHTFGVPANINAIKKITRKYNLRLIEDCCHALGAEYENKKTGTFGDAYGQIRMPVRKWILKQLLHPLIFSLVLPLYNLGLGKLILALALKMGIIVKPLEEAELSGGHPAHFPALLPNALAVMIVNQLKKLERFNRHRQTLATVYAHKLKDSVKIKLPAANSGAIYLRYNIFHPQANNLLKLFKEKEKIILGNWYKSIIDPEGVNKGKVGYTPHLCKNAEEAAELSLNLPTCPTLKKEQAEKIADLLLKYENH